jgi:hypothetical protein
MLALAWPAVKSALLKKGRTHEQRPRNNYAFAEIRRLLINLVTREPHLAEPV